MKDYLYYTKKTIKILSKKSIANDTIKTNLIISNNEINSVTEQLGSAVQMIYDSDMEVIG